MNRSFEYRAEKQPLDINHTLVTLRDALPRSASDLIALNHDMSNPLEQVFRDNPDSPAEHSPRWHQYGILTHSEQFRRCMNAGVPLLMEQWGLLDAILVALSQKIDGTSKADLLQLASLLHDIGKFTARTIERQDDGSHVMRFVDHEAHSGAIVRFGFNEALQKLGLSEAQIEYIAECTEHHFELGKVRRVSMENDDNYTMAFARSEALTDIAQGIISTNPELALEIGLMFIADNLSKTEVAATADTDEGIRVQRTDLEQEITHKGLNPYLIDQALQQPVNMAVARRYLQLWASS
jgi:hypothetical protein